jgi:diguanylate cyclase
METSASGSLLGWFGRRHAAGAVGAIALPGGDAGSSLAGQGRRLLMDAIAGFLVDNDLEITPDNLLAAHSAFAGENPRLGRRITARLNAGEPVTQQWLDVAAGKASEKDDDLERLISRLENNLDAFSRTTGAARKVTSDYQNELEQHVAELDQVPDTGEIISSLTNIARTMLERTRKVEEEMRRRDEEARSLRKSLARAKRDAEIDHLTGLPNRRAFEGLLDKHFREARAEIDALSVAFCDIDHFKQVNDMHGHDTGDRVIQAIAEALSVISDDNCHVARHGGEEFVMLFRGLTPMQAQARLDELRGRFAERNFVNRQTDEPIGQITFSGGVADVFGYADPRTALKAADEALYRAKEAGRNRIEIA